MRILLFRGKGFISSLIRWQTRSRQYSHAAILFDDGALFEAWQGKGVRVTGIISWVNVDAFACHAISPVQISQVRAFLMNQLGKPYDYVGVLRFVSRRKHSSDESKWFCSELVVAALRAADFLLFNVNVQPYQIAPEMICWSSHLVKTE